MTPWVLRIPAAITKNRTGRTLGLEGEVRAMIEGRLRARRFDCPLIFHRECKGKLGQPITDFWDVWRNALQAAGLPAGRLFHDLRRSAVRTLIRAGVDESTAMKVSGHKTRSMLLRYNIVTERKTADALLRADANRDWRKRVGIEPTAPGVSPGPDGFEGRAGHQTRIASRPAS